jgi:hypothetical protein
MQSSATAKIAADANNISAAEPFNIFPKVLAAVEAERRYS